MREKMAKYFRQVITGTCLVALTISPLTGFSQAPLPVPQEVPQPVPVPADNGQTGQPVQALSPDQLDGLVAPIALYPDPLISQILVASTYPLEVVEANQWLQRNPGLTGTALTQAAAAQNWDPSVQALVVFPDILKRLNEDVTWTTNLGNAFLNQQADVMSAVQRMRVRAEQNGRLASTPQQQVINTTDQGQPVVEIVPANPDVIYVPQYDPAWVWGPAAYYPYPSWYYPPYYRTGLFFGVGIGIGAFFGVGWGGWGGWGWHPAWGGRNIIVNNTFINRYNFNRFNSARFAGMPRQAMWSHDAFHRQGVPYPNRALTQRFGGNFRQSTAVSHGALPSPVPSRGFAASSRGSMPSAAPRQSFGASRPMTPSVANRNAFAAAPTRNSAPARSFAAPQARSYAPAPQARSYAAPQARSYAPQTRSYSPAPQMRSYAPARSAAPSGGGFSSHGGGGFSSHSGGGSVSHGGGGGSHGGGGRAKR